MSNYRPLVIGVYDTTETFRKIPAHTAVCFADSGLVAVTGPINDPESERYATLFAAAPDLLEALEGVIGWAEEAREKLRDSACPDAPTIDIDRAYAAIAKAKG